jgi:hypothetical protein
VSVAKPSPDEIRDYLLRRLPDGKRARFEEAYFSDDALLDRVEEAEDDLVSDYILGRLSASDKRHFEESLLETPYYRERVDTTTRFKLQLAGSRALRRGGPSLRPGGGTSSPGRTGLAVAIAFLAILFLAALASALRLKSDLEKSHVRARELASAVPPPAAQAGVVPVTQAVLIPVPREAGAPVYRVARPIGTPLLLVFSRQLLPDAARTFEVTLRDGGRLTWASGPQHAGPSDEGDLALRLPAGLPAPGRTAVLLSTTGGADDAGRLVGILDVSDKAP